MASFTHNAQAAQNPLALQLRTSSFRYLCTLDPLMNELPAWYANQLNSIAEATFRLICLAYLTDVTGVPPYLPHLLHPHFIRLLILVTGTGYADAWKNLDANSAFVEQAAASLAQTFCNQSVPHVWHSGLSSPLDPCTLSSLTITFGQYLARTFKL